MLFFDELDSIAKSRGGNVGDGGRSSYLYKFCSPAFMHTMNVSSAAFVYTIKVSFPAFM